MTQEKKTEKYIYLPEEFQKQHQCCFELVRQIENILTKKEYEKIWYTKIDITEEEIKRVGKCNDIFEYLEKLGRIKEFHFLTKKQLILGLIRDNCYFLQEALDASLKERLVVTYSLLRRPLIYNLKILLRILIESDFIDKFINEENFDSAYLRDKNLREYLDITDKIRVIKSIKGCDIYDFIFNQEKSGTILNLSNKAMHPSTTKKTANKTERMNLNFAFMTHEDNIIQWRSLYLMLIPVLMFYLDLINSLIISICEISDNILFDRYKKMSEIISHIS